jgi:biotin transport system substrate-specific component
MRQAFCKCFLGSVFIAFCSQVIIPMYPVPFTAQTLAIFIIASVLGPTLGAYSVMLFLIEGSCGLPVFAGFSSGLRVILGPTGGYLLGFVLAAYVVGRLLQKLEKRDFMSVFCVALIGDGIILAAGYFGLSRLVGASQAYMLGVLPFLITDTLKAILFALIDTKRSSIKC